MGQLFGKNSERIRNELSSGTLRKGFRKLRNELLGRSEMNRKSSERHDSERFRKQSSHRIRKASESVLFPKPFLSFRQGWERILETCDNYRMRKNHSVFFSKLELKRNSRYLFSHARSRVIVSRIRSQQILLACEVCYRRENDRQSGLTLDNSAKINRR